MSSSALAAWRIANTGHPWLDALPLERLVAEGELPLWTAEAANGHTVVFRSPGAIAAAIPPYLVSSRGTTLTELSLAPVAAWAAVLTACAMVLLFLALDRLLPRATALLGAVSVALTTPVWSVAADTLWTHTVTVFGIAGMAWAASRERWWLVGVFGGVALWGRLHAALIAAALGLLVAWWQRRPDIVLRVGLTSGAFLGAATLWSRWMYGEWDPAGGYPPADVYASQAAAGNRLEQLTNYLGLLVSLDRGLLTWTPILVLLLPAVIRNRRDLPPWVRALAVGGLAYGAAQGLMNHFAGGDAFYGYRLMLETLLCLAPAYILSAPKMGRVARAVIGPVLGLQCAMISVGAVTNTFFLSVDDAWSDNSLIFALREVPGIGLWLALLTLIGWLTAQVWRQRELGVARPDDGDPSPTSSAMPGDPEARRR